MSALDWLFGLEQFGIKLGLENIQALVQTLGHPELTFPSVHIAGTNGKGSVTAMVDAALGRAGYLSARYTSPHLLDLSERFFVGGQPIDSATLEHVVGGVQLAVERLLASGRLDTEPTFFEATTAAAFEIFRRRGAEIAVFEVGLGGRLDATNVLRPTATAITTIGLDHEQHLGTTLAAIAVEKAGIIKPGVPVVVGRLKPEALDAVRRVAAERGAEVIEATSDVRVRRSGGHVDLGTPVRQYEAVQLALVGDHQLDNAAVAVRLLEVLERCGFDIGADAIRAGLGSVVWPGRLETRRMPDGREVLLDAAHNPDGAAALAQYLRSTNDTTRPLVFAVMRDKDAAGMLGALAPAVGPIILTCASNQRSSEPAALLGLVQSLAPDRVTALAASPREALAAAWRLAPRIVVAGSIFLLADVVNELEAP